MGVYLFLTDLLLSSLLGKKTWSDWIWCLLLWESPSPFKGWLSSLPLACHPLESHISGAVGKCGELPSGSLPIWKHCSAWHGSQHEEASSSLQTHGCSAAMKNFWNPLPSCCQGAKQIWAGTIVKSSVSVISIFYKVKRMHFRLDLHLFLLGYHNTPAWVLCSCSVA